MKKMMVLLAATLVLGAGSFAQTSQPKKMDSTHKANEKTHEEETHEEDNGFLLRCQQTAVPIQ